MAVSRRAPQRPRQVDIEVMDYMYREPVAWCTVLLIAVTVLVSFLAFQNPALERKYIFSPESILAHKEYYRVVTSAFLHADWWHLGWNMLALYSFGRALEMFFGWPEFLLIYFSAIIGGSLLALFVHRHHQYLAYGASGGVCGIIFAFILLFPGAGVSFFIVPMPGWLYAIVFLAISFFAMKRGIGNVGHDAHIGGAIIGLLVAAVLNPSAVRDNLFVFLIVLVSATLLLAYLWWNPHLVPGTPSNGRPFFKRAQKSSPPPFTREVLQIDAILDKIAQSGVESLTAEEKSYLDSVSGKYQRRADSKKPESGLTI